MNIGDEILCVLSEEMSFEPFTAIWSRVSEREKKSKNPKFHDPLNNFGRDPPHKYV